jgi:hypothetical protein
MANGIGFSYQPGTSAAPGRQGQGAGGFRSVGPQEAIQTLSLRVPERANPVAPISRALMTAPGSSAAGADALTSMVAQLMQAFSGGGGMGDFLPGGGAREETGGAPPVATDTGQVMDDPRIRGPVITPNPTQNPGGGTRNPPPPRVSPGEDGRYPTSPPPRPPDVIDPPGREVVEDTPAPIPQDTPGLFDERVDLPPWLRIKAGQMPPLFGNDDIQFG